MDLKIVNHSTHELPVYKTKDSAGAQLRAFLPEEKVIYLQPGERRLIPTGLHMAIPEGMVGFICPRSGLALKQGVTVINAPGVIDADYRGDVGVPLINLGQDVEKIEDGDRVAQIVFVPFVQANFQVVETEADLGETERGQGGFGHTGKN